MQLLYVLPTTPRLDWLAPSPPNLKMKSSSLPGGCASSIIVIFDVGLYCDLLWALLWFSCGLIYLVIHLC